VNGMRDILLARLARSQEPVSGNVLARELHLSRAAVWKHIQALRRRGVRIAAGRRGYELQSDVLSAAWLAEHLRTKQIGRPCRVMEEVDSTNSELMRRAENGAGEGLVLLAERQTAGRGRLGRRWFTHSGGLAMSVLLAPPLPPTRAPQLSLLAAVAVHEALSNLAPGIRVKWPNDLVCGDGKLAGILTEMRAEPGRLHFVVVGVGVNVRAPAAGWPPEIAGLAADLSTAAGRNVQKLDVARRILEALDRNYFDFLERGFAFVRERWWQAHVARGGCVRVHHEKGYVEGIAEGLDEDGALLLRTDSGLMRIIAGDMEMK